MRANDRVTMVLTGRQVARLYVIMGASNGPKETSIFESLRNLISPERQNAIYQLGVERAEILDYNSYCDLWEQMVLDPEKTPQQIQIEELEATIRKAQEQIKQLKEV